MKNRSRSALRWVPLHKRSYFGVGIASAVAVALLGPSLAFAAERSEVLRRDFTLAEGEHRKVTIDNVFGSVHVSAGAGDRVTVEIQQRAKSRHAEDLAAAFDEVKLEVSQNGPRLELKQDGPFRCNDHGWGRHIHDCDWDPDYDLTWSWEVVVPAGVELEVSAVNDGEVVVEGVHGRVKASNVNGGVKASGLEAEAKISSVNGDLTASFSRVPAAGASFETVNGEIELVLPSDADADVGFETMNGEIYSDFEVEAVPQKTVTDERHSDDADRHGGGRKSYRLDRDAVVRIGAGGPRFDCETLNGDIVVRSR